jgi:hypothetical protein
VGQIHCDYKCVIVMFARKAILSSIRDCTQNLIELGAVAQVQTFLRIWGIGPYKNLVRIRLASSRCFR